MSVIYDSEEMFDEYRLTDEQLKATKAVFRAMKKAGKIGVHFWDMYGTLTAYNGNKFRSISMQDGENMIEVSNCEASELTYYEGLENFHAGCADDDVYLEIE